MSNHTFSLLLVLFFIVTAAIVSGAFLLAESIYNRRHRK